MGEEVQLKLAPRPISPLAIVLETEWPSLGKIVDSGIVVIGVAEAVALRDPFIDFFI